MNANEFTFGIEIECTMPLSYSRNVGPYGSPRAVEGLPDGWMAVADSSIRPAAGRTACEFVSPILQGAEGLREIIDVCSKIRAWNGKVNRTTGLHVHVGFDRTNEKALRRLVTLTSNFETAIFASTGTKSRERGAWAGSVRSHGDVDIALRHQRANRYHVLNLVNLLNGRKPTVEFRAFAGSINASKIIAHVRTCIGLVERALAAKQITKWIGKTPVDSSPLHRSGIGQTQICRLFYQLGWTKGRTKSVYGNLEGDGIPTLKSSKRTLMMMARKYDRD